jgi:YebC/PmpR family DNA-binding regulatory protein
MGRIFETRKATMFARWDKMSKAFTRIGKELSIAVKAGGPNPDNNPGLRRVIQNARAVNMPKDKVEAAIKRASGRDAADFEEVMYEGYAPHGVAVLVEGSTDNRNRTASEIRHVLVRPTDSPGANFAIESVRLVFRKEHLASIASGPSWQGLSEVYRETLVSRSPETLFDSL